MTGASLYTYVLATLKRTDKSTEVYQAMTDTVRDMRLRFKSEKFKSISTALAISTIGNYSVAFPSDFGHLIGDIMVKETSSDIDYNPPNKISIDEYNRKYASRYNTAVGNRLVGPPIDFCIFGGNLLIGPPVDRTTYQFRIAYSTEDLVEVDSSTTSVPFSDSYRKTLRYGILKNVYELLEMYEEAGYWNTEYEKDLMKIIENDNNNVRDESALKYNGV